MSRNKLHKIPYVDTVPIVANGAIAGPIADGAIIPILILDTRDRPDISEVIRVHRHLTPGDVRFQWGTGGSDDDLVLLKLEFDRPMEAVVVLPFSIETQAILVDAALRAQAVFLRAGVPGDLVGDDPLNPGLLVELPDIGFIVEWEKVLLGRITAIVAKRSKIPKPQARRRAQDVIEKMRETSHFRLPQA